MMISDCQATSHYLNRCWQNDWVSIGLIVFIDHAALISTAVKPVAAKITSAIQYFLQTNFEYWHTVSYGIVLRQMPQDLFDK